MLNTIGRRATTSLLLLGALWLVSAPAQAAQGNYYAQRMITKRYAAYQCDRTLPPCLVAVGNPHFRSGTTINDTSRKFVWRMYCFGGPWDLTFKINNQYKVYFMRGRFVG